MITKFSVLYVGFTELDNVGLGGTPPDERHLSNEQIVKAYKMSLDVAQHMDKLGFDTLWGAEHHFQREGYEVIPNLILWGTYLAARTERLKLGCAFNVSPVWHPIRLAEDFAMADILTDGRVIFGVGRGYQTREVETMGAPPAGPGRQPRAVRGADGSHDEGVPPGLVQPSRQALHHPCAHQVPRLRADRGDAGSASPSTSRWRCGRR